MTKTQMVMETTTIGDTMMSILLLVGSMQKSTLGHWSYIWLARSYLSYATYIKKK